MPNVHLKIPKDMQRAIALLAICSQSPAVMKMIRKATIDCALPKVQAQRVAKAVATADIKKRKAR